MVINWLGKSISFRLTRNPNIISTVFPQLRIDQNLKVPGFLLSLFSIITVTKKNTEANITSINRKKVSGKHIIRQNITIVFQYKIFAYSLDCLTFIKLLVL